MRRGAAEKVEEVLAGALEQPSVLVAHRAIWPFEGQVLEGAMHPARERGERCAHLRREQRAPSSLVREQRENVPELSHLHVDGRGDVLSVPPPVGPDGRVIEFGSEHREHELHRRAAAQLPEDRRGRHAVCLGVTHEQAHSVAQKALDVGAARVARVIVAEHGEGAPARERGVRRPRRRQVRARGQGRPHPPHHALHALHDHGPRRTERKCASLPLMLAARRKGVHDAMQAAQPELLISLRAPARLDECAKVGARRGVA